MKQISEPKRYRATAMGAIGERNVSALERAGLVVIDHEDLNLLIAAADANTAPTQTNQSGLSPAEESPTHENR